MKLGSVTKPDKRYKTMPEKFGDDSMPKNYDNIVIFPIFGQFGTIWKLESWRIVCQTYIFINSNLVSYK